MQHDLLLSIIIPNFNYEAFVGKAIYSVLSQAEPRVELVVIDDGSTDGSWAEISSFKNIRAFRIANGGALNACLFGLEKTTAPFVLFLDADDELKPNSLKRLVALLDSGVSKIQFALTRVNADGQSLGGAAPTLTDYRDSKRLKQRVLAKGVYRTPPTSGNIFRRDVCLFLKEIDYERFVDGIILYISPFLGDVISISDELGLYRVHGKNASNLGSRLDANFLKKDLYRFCARMEHLASILRRIDSYNQMKPYKSCFVFQERQLQIAIAERRRPSLRSILVLSKLLMTEAIDLKSKIGLLIMYSISYFVSIDRSRHLLEYRLSSHDRSALGFVRILLRRHHGLSYASE